jgi:hypothetical protein
MCCRRLGAAAASILLQNLELQGFLKIKREREKEERVGHKEKGREREERVRHKEKEKRE